MLETIHFRRLVFQGYIPTTPKAAVKIKSKKLFASVLNGPTHPESCAATSGFVQTLSVKNGGELLLK
jgi:hypothetical protein